MQNGTTYKQKSVYSELIQLHFDYSEIKNSKVYGFVIPPLWVLSKIVYKSRCHGKENVPAEGKLIIACNHVAFSDPALIVANCPRNVHYMAKSELFENPALAKLFSLMNAFPVKRATSDRRALRYAKEILDNGGALGIFPEGRRVRGGVRPTEGRSGIGYLARVTGADVLPCCIYKKEKTIRSVAVVRFGKVIKNSELGFDGDDKSAEMKRATALIMNRINDLWEEERCNWR